MKGIIPRITKDYILSRITQEQILERYLLINIPKDPQEYIKSPIRQDKHPTVTFKYIGNSLKMKDWNGSFYGDCFDVVGYLLGTQTSTKEGFKEVLEHIAQTFALNKYSDGRTFTPVTIKNHLDYQAKRVIKDISIEVREWNKDDGKYWSQFKVISLQGLKQYNVFPVEYASIDNTTVYHRYNPKDLCYYYHLGKEDGNNIGQLYYPCREKGHRFRTNNNRLFGMPYLKPAEVLVITKSNKDVLALKGLAKVCKISIDACSLPSEGHTLSKNDYAELWLHYNHIVSLFDYDYTGINSGIRHRKLYNIQPLFLTNGRNKTKNFKSKDITDFLKYNSLEVSMDLITNAYESIIRV